MYSLSYISDAVGASSVDEEAELVRAIMRQSRRNNADCGVSGLLAYAHGVFLQVLEGEKDVVELLYAHIATDPRHTNTQVLHRGEISERIYTAWGMGSAFRLGSINDHQDRITFLRSRFGKDRLASSADYFRYLLMPSRINNAGRRGRVRRVGIFASSALWFTPVFNAISDMSGVKPNSVLVSDPDTVASGFPVDYVDVDYNEEGAVRTTGFGKDLLRSPLINPFLKGIDLLAVLMRRSDTEANIEQLRTVLQLSEVQNAKPDVICITPGMDEAFSLELKAIGQSFGINVKTASASLLMGNDVLAIIKGWLVKHKLGSSGAFKLSELASLDSIPLSIPANAMSANHPTAAALKENEAKEVAARPAASAAEDIVPVVLHQMAPSTETSWLSIALNRIMSLPGAMQSFMIDTTTAQVIAAETRQLDNKTRQLMVDAVIDKFALIRKVGIDDEANEMVTTFTTCLEIVIRLPSSSSSSLALYTLFDRESTLLAALMQEIRAVINECADESAY